MKTLLFCVLLISSISASANVNFNIETKDAALLADHTVIKTHTRSSKTFSSLAPFATLRTRSYAKKEITKIHTEECKYLKGEDAKIVAIDSVEDKGGKVVWKESGKRFILVVHNTQSLCN
jgi:hypothetical protein